MELAAGTGASMEAGAVEQITLWTLFLQAHPVVKAVMLILVIASVWSWAVAVPAAAISGRRQIASRIMRRLHRGAAR